MNNLFVFDSIVIATSKKEDAVKRLNNKIILPQSNILIKELSPNYCLISNENKTIVLMNFKNYSDLTKRYRVIFSIIDMHIDYEFYLLSNKYINQQSFLKFKRLLRKRIQFLDDKIKLITPQIINSQDTIQEYFKNISQNSDSFLKTHFQQYEIPKEENRLAYLLKIEANSNIQKKAYDAFLANLTLL